MKLEKQVCNLEQAMKLEELGVKQESLFYYKANEIQTVLSERQMKEWLSKYLFGCNKYYSAFTASELVQMNENCYGISFSDKKKKFYSGEAVSNNVVYYENFAQACAAKLINAIEKEWVTIEEINQRLNN